jgi:hypothetical protein
VIWSTLVVAAVAGLVPAAEGELTLDNVRFTRGVLGPPRDKHGVLPGDSLFLCFDVVGVTVAEDGKVRYSTAIAVTGPDGRTVFKQDPRNLEATCSLGGNRVPAYASLTVGLEQPPGEYTTEVTVVDLATGKKASLKRTGEVLPRAFGVVRVSTTSDAEGLLPAPTPGVGQGLWVHFGVVGFDRGSGKQPDVQLSLKVLDGDGKPVLARPQTEVLNRGVPDNVVALPLRMPLLLNRPGQFTVEVSATDRTSGKTDTVSFPLTVWGK